jgi:hypothetical protein
MESLNRSKPRRYLIPLPPIQNGWDTQLKLDH